MNGIETIKEIWALDEDIQIVICTAYSDYTWEEMVEQLGMSDSLLILNKPFAGVAVRKLACALTKKWQSLQKTKQYANQLEKTVQKHTNLLKKSLLELEQACTHVGTVTKKY